MSRTRSRSHNYTPPALLMPLVHAAIFPFVCKRGPLRRYSSPQVSSACFTLPSCSCCWPLSPKAFCPFKSFISVTQQVQLHTSNKHPEKENWQGWVEPTRQGNQTPTDRQALWSALLLWLYTHNALTTKRLSQIRTHKGCRDYWENQNKRCLVFSDWMLLGSS